MNEYDDMYDYCERWCDGELTHAQGILLERAINEGRFIGVGREIGGVEWLPLISLDIRGKTLKVIDRLGYYVTPSLEGRKSYWSE